MNLFSRKLEKGFPVVERRYRVGRNGIVKQLAELKNLGTGNSEFFPAPYVETVKSFLQRRKGFLVKRTLLVTENETLALKVALLIREMHRYYQVDSEYEEFEDDLDDYDFELWDEAEEEIAEEKMLRVVSLKQSESPDKGEMNQYIARISETGPETVVLFTGLSESGNMTGKLEAIGACPGEMQFIQISKEQLKEPWAQELRMDFHCDVLEIGELQQDYFEKVLRYLMKGEEYTLAPEISAKVLIHKIQKSKWKNIREEDLAWHLDEGVSNAAQRHPRSKILNRRDFPLLFDLETAPMKQLLEMTGMKSVKEMAKEFAAIVQEEMQNKSLGILHKNMIFLGNPGTGKTTCAKLLANIMAEEGHTNASFVVATRKDLVGEYVGHTAPKVAAKFEEARGGILFVDEAGFFLNTNSGGYVQEAVKEFVRYMEIYPDVTVIFAMYAKEASAFLELDPGLSSRISRFVNFEDYTDEELCLIARDMLRARGYTLEKEAEEVVMEYMEQLRKDKKKSFGNAREARKLVESAIVAACVQKYSKSSGGKYSEKGTGKTTLRYAENATETASADGQNNDITAEHIRQGWNRLQQESVRKQEMFGFAHRQTEAKVLCCGQ